MSALRALVIFLHGVGSNGADLAPIGQMWAPAMPGVAFASPDAPQRFGAFGSAYQWFSIAGVTPENRADRVEAARAGFDATIDAVMAEHGLAGQYDKVVLVGFSQGSIMSLDALASGRRTYHAIVAFSGRLSTPEPISPAKTPLILIHGDADPTIPSSESVKAAEVLEKAGVNLTLHVQPGVPHTISQEGAALALAFIIQNLD
jgi:phospholipase/carboxylesterase